MNTDEKIDRLMMFTNKLFQHQNTRDFNQRMELREWLNQNVQWVRREVIEAGCQKIMTISPPPALGGLIMRGLDPFDHMFGAPYGVDLVLEIPDMIDATIGVLRNPPPRHAPSGPIIKATVQSGYAFVAMPIDKDDHQLVDVLTAPSRFLRALDESASLRQAGAMNPVELRRIDPSRNIAAHRL